MTRWPFFNAAAWGVWRLFYATLVAVVVAIMAPIVGIAAWPAYQWLGVGWSVLLWAVLVFGTRNSRRIWVSDARRRPARRNWMWR
jgi:heme exporter protein D